MHTPLILALSALLGLDPGETLLRRMNDAHRADWFTTLIFEQRTTWPGTDRPEETWYETMVRPGRLRLDMERGGVMIGRSIFRNDSIYQTMEGRPPVTRPLVHPLLVLLHDVHVGPIDDIVRKVRALGFDLARTHEATWQGRAVRVVGAEAGDTTSRQFWVDAERLVVVRLIQPGPNGNTNDTQVGGFTAEGPALVERRIDFLSNGRPSLVEEYVWVKSGVAIGDDVFDPAGTALPAWVVERRAARR